MKPGTLPDGFAVVLIWGLLAAEIALAAAMPQNVDPQKSVTWFIPCLVIAWTAAYFGMRRFRNKHKDAYEELGRPRMFGPPYERTTRHFVSYLLTFRFTRLKDARLTACFFVFLGFTAIALVLLLSTAGG